MMGLSFAGANTTVVLQAETLTGSGSIVADPTASANEALMLTTAAAASGNFTLNEVGSKLLIKARGDQCDGAPQIVVAIDGKDQPIINVSSTAWTLYISTPKILVGPHTISARLVNPYASQTCIRAAYLDVLYIEKDPVKITADTIAPSIAITTPTNAAFVQDAATISVSATDNVAVSKVEFYISGQNNNLAVGTVTAPPYVYIWDTKSVPNGPYTLSAKAFDAAGNVSLTSSTAITVNNSPSGQNMPVGNIPGWTQIFSDDFTTNAPLGTFTSAYGTKWSGYVGPDSASKRTPEKKSEYNIPKVVSVNGGVLDEYLHTEYKATGFNGPGNYMMSAALLPKGLPSQTYGRYSVRLRSDAVDGYKIAWMLWPNSGTNITGSASGTGGNGEIDFAEANLTNPLWAFIHWQDATIGSQQSWFKTIPPVYLNSGWHTVTLEWGPTTRIYVDGLLEAESTVRIPNSPMHLVLQTESDKNATPMVNSGHLQLDWVSIYKMQ